MNATITVMDRHFTDGDGEPEFGKLQTMGTLEKEGDALMIRYRETVESPNDCDTSLKVEKERITMMRTGRYRTGMIFENGKRHTAHYETPQGGLFIGIYTNAMLVDLDEDGGMLNFAYTIDCNGDLVSENELKIFVEVKD